MTVPSLVWLVIALPKKTTDVPMMQTRLTTLHTPCATGVTRDNVLNANCMQRNRMSVPWCVCLQSSCKLTPWWLGHLIDVQLVHGLAGQRCRAR